MVIVIVACKTLVTVSAPSNDLIPVPGSLSVCVSAMSNHYPGLWVLFPCPYHRPVQSPSRSQSAFPLSLSLLCFVLILVSGLFSLVPVSALSNHYPELWVLVPCHCRCPVYSPSRSQSSFPLSLSPPYLVSIPISKLVSLVSVSALFRPDPGLWAIFPCHCLCPV